jgi:hypothetical protein
MTTSEQLERETERTRAHIAETLDELRARMTPGQVVDQLLDYANDSSGGMFVSNLRRQVVNNPLPVTLVGAGLAWLALSRRSRPPARRGNGSIRQASAEWSEQANEWSERSKTAAYDAKRRAGETASDVEDAAYGAADSIAGAASDAYDSVTERASATYDTMTGKAAEACDSAAGRASATYDSAADQVRRVGDTLRSTASNVGGSVSGAGRNIAAMLHDQPLVLAGLGLAIGALIGAVLPSSDVEDELMGESSNAVKRQATEFVEEQAEKGKAVAEEAWQGAKAEAQKQGVTPGHDGGSPPQEADATLVPSVGDTEHRSVQPSGS